jgi:hypothetical protein
MTIFENVGGLDEGRQLWSYLVVPVVKVFHPTSNHRTCRQGQRLAYRVARPCRRSYREYAVSLDQDDMGSIVQKRIIKWDIEIQSLRGRTPRLQQRSLICTLSPYTQVYKTAQVSTASLPRYVFRGRDACFARRRIRNQTQTMLPTSRHPHYRLLASPRQCPA